VRDHVVTFPVTQVMRALADAARQLGMLTPGVAKARARTEAM
jgi:hypothetical protein